MGTKQNQMGTNGERDDHYRGRGTKKQSGKMESGATIVGIKQDHNGNKWSEGRPLLELKGKGKGDKWIERRQL